MSEQAPASQCEGMPDVDAEDCEASSPAPSRGGMSMSARGAPPSILSRFAEYTSLPDDVALHQQRHRDSPCVYRQSLPWLWDASQRGELDALFKEGWKSDPGNPILSLLGNLRPSSSHLHDLDSYAAHAELTEAYRIELKQYQAAQRAALRKGTPPPADAPPVEPRSSRVYKVSASSVWPCMHKSTLAADRS